MDFVDKEDVLRLEGGEDGGHIPGPLNGRAGSNLDVHSHFLGNDVGQGGFAQARRPVEDDMIQRLPPQLGRLDANGQIILDLGLAHELRQLAGAQGKIQVFIIRAGNAGDNPFGAGGFAGRVGQNSFLTGPVAKQKATDSGGNSRPGIGQRQGTGRQ